MSVRATNRFILWTAVALWATAPLVGAQTPPSVTDAEKFTPLHRAATAGDPGRIGKLAADGADLNARDPHGRTPLMVAAFARSLPAATALIETGAKLDLLENDRYDALTISAVIDDPAMVKLLIAKGADTGLVTSRYDGTALIAAAHLGHVEVVKALIAGKAPLDHVNNLRWTALIEAIVLGDGGPAHVACVRALVDAGADVNLADGEGRSPLALATGRGYAAIIEILKRAGAKP